MGLTLPRQIVDKLVVPRRDQRAGIKDLVAQKLGWCAAALIRRRLHGGRHFGDGRATDLQERPVPELNKNAALLQDLHHAVVSDPRKGDLSGCPAHAQLGIQGKDMVPVGRGQLVNKRVWVKVLQPTRSRLGSFGCWAEPEAQDI